MAKLSSFLWVRLEQDGAQENKSIRLHSPEFNGKRGANRTRTWCGGDGERDGERGEGMKGLAACSLASCNAVIWKL